MTVLDFFLMEVLLCPPVCFVLFCRRIWWVLREEVVGWEALTTRAPGSGTEQVYLSLTLSVSMTRSPLRGSISTLVGPCPCSLLTHSYFGGPNLWVLHLTENGNELFMFDIKEPWPVQQSAAFPQFLCFHFLTVCFFHLKQSILVITAFLLGGWIWFCKPIKNSFKNFFSLWSVAGLKFISESRGTKYFGIDLAPLP